MLASVSEHDADRQGLGNCGVKHQSIGGLLPTLESRGYGFGNAGERVLVLGSRAILAHMRGSQTAIVHIEEMEGK